MSDQISSTAHQLSSSDPIPNFGDKGKEKEIDPVATPTDFKVWSPPASSPAASSSLSTIPDSFFEPTTAELKAAFDAQARLRENLYNAPLKTQAVRDQEEKKKQERWPNTTIRIKFPDQTQLEKVFPSTNTIKSVYAFVRSSLTDEAKPVKFVLYQAPPRRDYKVSDPAIKPLTLAQLSFAPSTVLQLRFEDDALNSVNSPPPLLPAILAHAIPLPSPIQFDPTDTTASRDVKGKAKVNSSSQGEKKVPKWFKMGPKK